MATTWNHSAIGFIKSLHFVIFASNFLSYQMLRIYSPLSSAELITILKLILTFFVHILTLLLYMNGSTTIYGNVFHILIIYMHGNLFRASFCNSLFLLSLVFSTDTASVHFHRCVVFHSVSILPFISHSSIEEYLLLITLWLTL